MERAEFTNGRPPAMIESELTLEEPGESIFSMHVLQIILRKIERLQKKPSWKLSVTGTIELNN